MKIDCFNKIPYLHKQEDQITLQQYPKHAVLHAVDAMQSNNNHVFANEGVYTSIQSFL